MTDLNDDLGEYDDPAFPPYPGHPHWCGTIDQPLDCPTPDHSFALGMMVGLTCAVTVVLTYVDGEARISLVADDGPILVLPLAEAERFDWLAHKANVIGHGGWPRYEIA